MQLVAEDEKNSPTAAVHPARFHTAAMQLVAEDEKNINVGMPGGAALNMPQCSSSRRTRRTRPHTQHIHRGVPAAMQLVAEDEKNLGSLFWLGIKWFKPQCSSSRRTRRTGGHLRPHRRWVTGRNAARRGGREEHIPASVYARSTNWAAMQLVAEDEKNVQQMKAAAEKLLTPQCSSSRRTRRTARKLPRTSPQPSSRNAARRGGREEPLVNRMELAVESMAAMQLVAEDEKNLMPFFGDMPLVDIAAMQLVAEDEKNQRRARVGSSPTTSRNAARRGGREEPAAGDGGPEHLLVAAMQLVAEDEKNRCPAERVGISCHRRNAARRGGREKRWADLFDNGTGNGPQCSSSRRTRRTMHEPETRRERELRPQCSSSRRTRRTRPHRWEVMDGG